MENTICHGVSHKMCLWENIIIKDVIMVFDLKSWSVSESDNVELLLYVKR